MPTDADRPVPFAIPRPGVVTTLGILNVVFSLVILIGLLTEVLWLISATRIAAVVQEGGAGPSAGPPNLMTMGMTDPRFLRFCVIDAVTGTVLNLAMLASGITLLNFRRWGARLWKWAAWIKIARLLVLGGFFVVAVSPSLSESMARSVVTIVKPPGSQGKGPQVGDFIWIYSLMNLFLAAGTALTGSIYPALSLWMLGRPGVKAALAGAPSKEPGRP